MSVTNSRPCRHASANRAGILLKIFCNFLTRPAGRSVNPTPTAEATPGNDSVAAVMQQLHELDSCPIFDMSTDSERARQDAHVVIAVIFELFLISLVGILMIMSHPISLFGPAKFAPTVLKIQLLDTFPKRAHCFDGIGK